MSTFAINNSSYLQPILATTVQGTGSTNKIAGNTTTDIASAADNGQISRFAQVLNTLQQLQQSNPAKYRQLTTQIATSLQNAAQTAQSEGNTTAASRLTQLARDFANASQNRQLPNIRDLAQAIGGHHQHHHAQPASTVSDTDSSAGSGNQVPQRILAAFQSGGTTASDPLDPMTVIANTLASSRITVSGN
jgi:DNA polymerase III gamma/tau subunit